MQAEKQSHQCGDTYAAEEHIEQDDNKGSVGGVNDKACAMKDIKIILVCAQRIIKHQRNHREGLIVTLDGRRFENFDKKLFC